MLTLYRFFKNIHLNKYKNSISEKEIVLLYVVLIQNNTQQYSTLMKKVLTILITTVSAFHLALTLGTTP